MMYFVLCIFLSFFCVEGKFQKKYEDLRTVWGQEHTQIPVYNEEVEKIAENNASDYIELDLEQNGVYQLNDVTFNMYENSAAFYSVVNGSDENEAIAKFIALETVQVILKKDIKLVHLYTAKAARVQDVFKYCVAGGVAAIKYGDVYVVWAYFELGFSEEYEKLNEAAKGPVYNVAVEAMAKKFASTVAMMPGEPLDEMKGSFHTVANHTILLIQSTTLKLPNFVSNERNAIRKFVETLSNPVVWETLISLNDVRSHFPSHKSLATLIGLATDGGISVAMRRLPIPVEYESGRKSTRAFKICAYFRFEKS